MKVVPANLSLTVTHAYTHMAGTYLAGDRLAGNEVQIGQIHENGVHLRHPVDAVANVSQLPGSVDVTVNIQVFNCSKDDNVSKLQNTSNHNLHDTLSTTLVAGLALLMHLPSSLRDLAKRCFNALKGCS